MIVALARILFPFAVSLQAGAVLAAGDEELPPGTVAAAEGVQISASELFEYLASVYRRQDAGKELLEQMVREEAIRQELDRRKLAVSQDALDARYRAWEAQLKAEGGESKGLLETIRGRGIEEREFFELMRLSIGHEMMARADFGISGSDEVPVEKLNLWLKELLGRTQVVTEATETGTAAAVCGRAIPSVEFGRRLAALLGKEKTREALTEMVGIRLIPLEARKRGIALGDEDLQDEVEAREEKLHSMPGFERISYRDFLKASTGQTLEDLLASDRFRSEALLRKLAATLQTEADLRAFFERNRDSYERRFGESARVATIFLRAARFTNQMVARTFEEAARELDAIRKRIERGEAAFEHMASIYSEHESSRQQGDLGFLPRGSTEFGEIAAAALAADVGAVLGPFHTSSGCHLIKVLEKRGSVSYEAVRGVVAADARQDLYRDILRSARVRVRL